MGFSGITKSNKCISLIDIRLDGIDHDVLVLKGPPDEAPSLLLSGRLILSINDPIQIKKIILKMYGVLSLNISDLHHGSKSPGQKINTYEKMFYENVWDHGLFEKSLHKFQSIQSQGNSLGRSISSSTLSSLHRKTKSTASLISLGSYTPTSVYSLDRGNYEFPFSVLIPGSITESVEGLPNASIVYKLQAIIERGNFTSPLILKRHIRVIRTITLDAPELSETVSAENIWPNKVEYSILVPNKAVAIGSSTSINITIIPLSKGLTIGLIKIYLVEYSSYYGPFGVNSQERIITKLKLKRPLQDKEDTVKNTDISDDIMFQDKWEISSILKIPSSLSKCTQDCNLQNIKVRHKIKIEISLINLDGHVSELRASLPIQLFISPFVALSVKRVNSLDGSKNIVNDSESDPMIFNNSFSTNNLMSLNNTNDNVVDTNTLVSLMTPPTYSKHIYDRLWCNISSESTSVNSGAQSPIELPQGSCLNTQQDISVLQTNLQQLHMEREPELYTNDDVESDCGLNFDARTSNARPITQLAKNDINYTKRLSLSSEIETNIVRNNSSTLKPSQSTMSLGVRQKSHSTLSDLAFPMGARSNSDWALDSLSKVPSYNNAIKSDSSLVDLPPAYNFDESFNNTINIERDQPFKLNMCDSLITGRSRLLHNSIPRNNSSNSLHKNILLRTDTGGSNISTTSSYSTSLIPNALNNSKNTATKHFGFGMTPLNNNKDEYFLSSSSIENQQYRSQIPQRNSLKSSISSLSRNSSFSNISGLLQRKEKK